MLLNTFFIYLSEVFAYFFFKKLHLCFNVCQSWKYVIFQCSPTTLSDLHLTFPFTCCAEWKKKFWYFTRHTYSHNITVLFVNIWLFAERRTTHNRAEYIYTHFHFSQHLQLSPLSAWLREYLLYKTGEHFFLVINPTAHQFIVQFELWVHQRICMCLLNFPLSWWHSVRSVVFAVRLCKKKVHRTLIRKFCVFRTDFYCCAVLEFRLTIV